MQFYEIVIKTKAGLAVDHISRLILGNKAMQKALQGSGKAFKWRNVFCIGNGWGEFILIQLIFAGLVPVVESDIHLDRALPVPSQGKSGGVLKHLIAQTANDLGDDEWGSGAILQVLCLKNFTCRPTFATISLVELFSTTS